MGRSIRTDLWRYTEWRNARDELVGTELYDETADPQETTSLSGEAGHASTVAELAARLKAGWQEALPPK